MRASSTALPCPCQSGKRFEECCAPLIAGELAAETAEALMRSRYTAYTLRDEAYLLATWHPSTRPPALELAADPAPKWIGLQIRQFLLTGPETAIVEFVARYRVGGRAHRLRETSRFALVAGRWMYLDGDVAE